MILRLFLLFPMDIYKTYFDWSPYPFLHQHPTDILVNTGISWTWNEHKTNIHRISSVNLYYIKWSFVRLYVLRHSVVCLKYYDVPYMLNGWKIRLSSMPGKTSIWQYFLEHYVCRPENMFLFLEAQIENGSMWQCTIFPISSTRR